MSCSPRRPRQRPRGSGTFRRAASSGVDSNRSRRRRQMPATRCPISQVAAVADHFLDIVSAGVLSGISPLVCALTLEQLFIAYGVLLFVQPQPFTQARCTRDAPEMRPRCARDAPEMHLGRDGKQDARRYRRARRRRCSTTSSPSIPSSQSTAPSTSHRAAAPPHLRCDGSSHHPPQRATSRRQRSALDQLPASPHRDLDGLSTWRARRARCCYSTSHRCRYLPQRTSTYTWTRQPWYHFVHVPRRRSSTRCSSTWRRRLRSSARSARLNRHSSTWHRRRHPPTKAASEATPAPREGLGAAGSIASYSPG